MLHFHPIPTIAARALQAGRSDANNQPPERTTSTGPGNPYRQCLDFTLNGTPMPTLA